MLGLIILILNTLFLDCFCTLPNAWNANEMFLFFGAMACEDIKYVVIAFQNTFVDILYIDNHKIILSG